MPSPEPTIDLEAAAADFDYPAPDMRFDTVEATSTAGVTVRDVTYGSVDGRVVSAFLVMPDDAGPHPAIVFLHWVEYGSPDSNRTEFLEEAKRLARRGIVSLLPDQVFPWHESPDTGAHDHQAVIDQVIDIRVGLEGLLALPGVDPDRLALVGHDFGGMYAALVGGLEPRVDGAVIMAPVPHWADWFLPYWNPPGREEPDAYRRLMLDVDPVTFMARMQAPVFLQFATADQYVNAQARTAWYAAAPPGSPAGREYDSNHSLKVEAAEADRAVFLARVLALGD
jgi:dienelactone hydrolase